MRLLNKLTMMVVISSIMFSGVALAESLDNPFSRTNVKLSYDNKANSPYWDGIASIGGDYDRVSIWSEGTGKEWRASLVYTRYLSRFWDAHLGLSKVKGYANLLPTIGITGVTPYYIETEGLLILHKHSTILDLTLTHEFQITDKTIFYPQLKTLASNRTADGFRSGVNSLGITIGAIYQYSGGLEIFTEGYRDYEYLTKIKTYGARLGIRIKAF